MGQSPMQRLVRSIPGLATLLHAGLWTGESTPPGYKVTRGSSPCRSEAPFHRRGKSAALARWSCVRPSTAKARNDPACLELEPPDNSRLEERASEPAQREAPVDLLDDRIAGGRGPSIGIGGRLATPPLPHHRAYGSVHGGSRSCANTIESVGWAFGFTHHRERFDVFPSRLPGFTRRRR